MKKQKEQDNPQALNPVVEALAAPFGENEVKFRPQVVRGNRALALAYVDVRAIMDRLDSVVGVENWQDNYELLPDNSVMCRLREFGWATGGLRRRMSARRASSRTGAIA